jgi:tyrosine-protein phosphatase YwqE
MSFFQFFDRTAENFVNVDIHSHLIPSIDDGAKNMERSIEMILSLKEMGYSKLITTPHVSDMFPNSKQTILDGYSKLKEELDKREIEIDLEVAAEYYADDTFDMLLKQRDILTFGAEKYLLFELSYFTEPQDLEGLIQEIILAGYTPVLAHPERYTYFHNDFTKYEQLKSTGVLFQINLNSVVGYYSSEIEKVVKNLINEGLVDFIGSDTHHRQHLKALKACFKSSEYRKVLKKNKLLNDTLL